MKSGAFPFKFDMSDLTARIQGLASAARRHAGNRLTGATVTLSLPFVSVAVAPKDRERQAARELVIRLKDRRVLSAWECCDDCIDRALASLQEIRRLLVDKQVELGDLADGPLYLLIDAMALAIRQFLTFEETLNERPNSMLRPRDVRQDYFDALEMLRGHLSRCLGQVAAIAGMPGPSDGLIAKYQGPWEVEAYVAETFGRDASAATQMP
jgi:hypothetical protein